MAEYIMFTPKVEGPCKKVKHEGWIELTNWGWGCKRDESGGNQIGLASGIAKFEPLHFEATTGSATIVMFQKMLQGTHFDEAKIECTKSVGSKEPETWMTVHLKHVLVTGIEQTVESDTANDTVNLSFSQVHVLIADQDEKGVLGKPKEVLYDLTTAIEGGD